MEGMFGLEGKVALVTGGAYGIGFAIGRALGMAGARIAFNCSTMESLQLGWSNYDSAGIDALGFKCDVTDPEQVDDMIKEIEARCGSADILVNNAGIIKREPMTEMKVDDFRRVLDVDLTGPFICSKRVIPEMIKKGGGKIINICSLMSEVGREKVSAYAAAKGGLRMLTRNICAEYGKYNIQCNAIAPGYIETPQTAMLREKGADGEPSSFDKFIISRTPAGRWGRTEDLMGPALFLASSASNFVNGQILYVDGGLLSSLGAPSS